MSQYSIEEHELVREAHAAPLPANVHPRVASMESVTPNLALIESVLGHFERLAAWIGSSLGRRFVTMSLLVLLAIQVTSMLVIDASLRRHAFVALPKQVAMGGRTLESLISRRAEKLSESSRLLASDYGFREAVLSHDRETIASALSNHGARIGATGVALLRTDFSTEAVADGFNWDADEMSRSVARLAAAAVANTEATEVALVNGVPCHVVLVPMRAPMLVGWVLVYFPMSDNTGDKVYQLTGADLTMLARARPADGWKVAFSRLDAAHANVIALRARPEQRDDAPNESMRSLEVGKHDFGLRSFWLTSDVLLNRPQAEVMAVISVPEDDALHAPRDLQIALLATTLLGFLTFGVGSAWTARRITTPLQSLASAAARLGSGDYVTPIRSERDARDEVGNLARAFEQMRVSLATKQEQIVQSEKLASIGQLAAGVAHEINNPIGFVFSNFSTLEDYLARLFRMVEAYRAEEAALAGTPAAARLAKLREEIELDYLAEDIPALMSESKDGIKRVRKIVQDLKDFSHVDARQQWEAVDLHVGLDSTLNIVNNEIKYKADVVKAYGHLPQVECLPSELNQVFMNLLVNAAHAIGEQRGTITIRSGVSGPGGSEAWVEVADTGSGIAPDNLKRIFDPFFTTKPVGKGTGLGLSLSYGIVKKHGGRFDVKSELGKGTAFRVIVPVKRVVLAA